jgi:hypothetical protein
VGEMFTFCGAEVNVLMCLTFYVWLLRRNDHKLFGLLYWSPVLKRFLRPNFMLSFGLLFPQDSWDDDYCILTTRALSTPWR